jgi:hypothetical protein
MDMSQPPTWFEDWDQNEFVFGGDQTAPAEVKKKTLSLAEIASRLA